MRAKVTTLLVLSSVLLLNVPVAEGDQRGRRASHHRTAITVKSLPRGHQAIVVGGASFYFNAGVFYRKGASGFVSVAAPVNARITLLPRGHTTVVIGGSTYYHYYGTYYRHDPAAGIYVVVEPPVEQPSADVIRLVSGEVLEGRFVSGGETSLRFEVAGEIHHIPLEEIVSIDFAPPPAGGP